MNKSRLVGGIICLALAALITVLIFTLPEENMMFMIGDQNMPIVPAIVLAIVGVWLLSTAKKSNKEDDIVIMKEKQPADPQLTEKQALNKRLETAGWGLFLIMLGASIFIPDEQIPSGVWSVGIGLIFLGLNFARAYYGIKMSGFTTVLGILAVISGITQLLGLHSLDLAILLIILGAYLILKPWFDKRDLFGEVAES